MALLVRGATDLMIEMLLDPEGAPGGGFILSASGCLSGGTPVENIEAMVNAAARYGRYPIGGSSQQ